MGDRKGAEGGFRFYTGNGNQKLKKIQLFFLESRKDLKNLREPRDASEEKFFLNRFCQNQPMCPGITAIS
jgi:hypothetical protein